MYFKKFHNVAMNDVRFENLLPGAAAACWQAFGGLGTDLAFVRSLPGIHCARQHEV